MTYAKGSNIVASDYNQFAGLTGTAAASSAAATGRAGYLYGIGYGDRGYGQASPTLIAKNIGDAVGQEWANLRSVLQNMASWQGLNLTQLPPSTAFVSGAPITAHEIDPPSSNSYDIGNVLSALDSFRFNYQMVNMSLTNIAASSTRNTAWGSGSGGIVCEFAVTFASENEARYFFNTCGELRISLNHPSTLTSLDSSWNTVLNNLTVAFRAHDSSRISGAYGLGTSIGYYELTTAYQTILDGTNTGLNTYYDYSTNDFIVSAKALSIPGVNGGKGRIIHFKVELIDQQTNAFNDEVQPGTSATVSYLKASSLFTIAAPVVSNLSNF